MFQRPPPSRAAALALLAAAALAAGCAAGCARAPRPVTAPPAPPPAPAPAAPPAPVAAAPGPYAALSESLAGRDPAPLRGRRVALDPGHGGAFRGALGPGGLAEADVNLGVALALRDLLGAAGAEVMLTRDADRDLLTPSDSSLGADLAARVALAKAWRPDVFLSIHHNSTAPRDTSANETQTYYPVGRDGADLDLARAVHRHLARNLGIIPARILPGNFRVLREADVPAVLGEPAMISNPEMERRLAQPAKQRLEAAAYFLGLLEYFAGGDPRWTTALGDTARDPVAPFVWRFAPGGDAARPGPGLDPGSVELRLDGAAQAVGVDPDGVTLRWYPPVPAPSGRHRVAVTGRNLAGRATRDGGVVWLESVRRPRLLARFHPPLGIAGAPDPAGTGLLTWELRDQADRLVPCRDARLAAADGGDPPAPLPDAPAGRGWQVLRQGDLPGRPVLHATGPGGVAVEGPVTVAPGLPAGAALLPLVAPAPWAPGHLVPGDAWRSRRPLTPGTAAGDDGWLRDPAAPLVVCGRADGPVWLEADGALPIVVAGPAGAPAWQPLLPALIDVTIVIDPAGGGADSDGAPGPSGVRGADLNLGVARALAALLRGAGARVLLTREDERWVAPEAKLLLANDAPADLCLVVRRAGPGEAPFGAFHHATSARGRRWARLLARAAAPLAAAWPAGAGADSVRAAPAATYLLRQTACPALEATLPPADSSAREDLLERPDHEAACARALLLATAALLAGPELLATALDPEALMAAHPELVPEPARVRWARLDGNLTWLPPRWCRPPGDTLSSCGAPGLPCAGPVHTLEVHDEAGWRLLALQRSAGGFTGQVLLEGVAGPASPPERSPETDH